MEQLRCVVERITYQNPEKSNQMRLKNILMTLGWFSVTYYYCKGQNGSGLILQ